MVNFSIQINYLVLAFLTAKTAAEELVKSFNDTNDEFARTAHLVAVDSTSSTDVSKGRDNYSYYYGRLLLGYTCTVKLLLVNILQLVDGPGTFHSISCCGSCYILRSMFSDLSLDIKFSIMFLFGVQKFS